MTTSPPAWHQALERLLNAPALHPEQTRYLFSQLGVPRNEPLEVLLTRLGDANPQRAQDASFVLETVLMGVDRPVIRAFVDGNAPVKIRAQARALFQNGILHGRISEADADLPPPPSELLDFHVEDAVRQIGRIPSPWQRARIAAETLVGDAPLPDDVAEALVTRLANRVDVDPAAIWAELRIHPLTRPSYRTAAANALGTPSHAAATMFELALRGLLPGELRTIAESEARRHRAAPAPAWQARMSSADGRGGFAVLFFVDGPVPTAFAASLSSEAANTQAAAGEGPLAEHALAAGWRFAEPRGGLVRVPLDVALNEVRTIATWLSTNPKKPDVHFSTTKDWIARIESLTGLKGVAAPVPSASALDVALLHHPHAKNIELVAADLPESSRTELGREVRLFGRPRDETLLGIARDIAKKGAVPGRLVRAFEHAARIAQSSNDAAATGFAALAAALQKPAEAPAQQVLAAMLKIALASAAGNDATTSSRDDLRDDVIPDLPSGKDVLALDLGAAGLDAAIKHGRVLDGIKDPIVIELHAESGRLASDAALVKEAFPSEDKRLEEAAKEAIKRVAPNLPSRQRRELQELWVKAWQELLANACRGTCNQQCPMNVDVPRPFGAFSLDHPRLNKPWP